MAAHHVERVGEKMAACTKTIRSVMTLILAWFMFPELPYDQQLVRLAGMRRIKSGVSGGGKATSKVGVEVALEHGCAFVGFEFGAKETVPRSAWPARIALVVVIGSFQTTAGSFMFSRPPSSICMHACMHACICP
jgi:hypothetical protein